MNFLTKAEKEFAEHKSIALRVFASCLDPRDNVIRDNWKLKEDSIVLIRGNVGFHSAPLEKDKMGWFVRVDEDSNKKTRVELDHDRKCWVIRKLIVRD